MRRSRRSVLCGIMTLLAAAWLGLTPSPAVATDYCDHDHGIWLTQSNQTGYGSLATIQKVNDG
jgi:hypothetical protein